MDNYILHVNIFWGKIILATVNPFKYLHLSKILHYSTQQENLTFGKIKLYPFLEGILLLQFYLNFLWLAWHQ